MVNVQAIRSAHFMHPASKEILSGIPYLLLRLFDCINCENKYMEHDALHLWYEAKSYG